MGGNVDLGFISDVTDGIQAFVSGEDAKDAANNARKQAMADQDMAEFRLYEQKQKDKGRQEMQAQQAAVRRRLSAFGGRSGTVLTNGLDSSASQVQAGKKVLLGE